MLERLLEQTLNASTVNEATKESEIKKTTVKYKCFMFRIYENFIHNFFFT